MRDGAVRGGRGGGNQWGIVSLRDTSDAGLRTERRCHGGGPPRRSCGPGEEQPLAEHSTARGERPCSPLQPPPSARCFHSVGAIQSLSPWEPGGWGLKQSESRSKREWGEEERRELEGEGDPRGSLVRAANGCKRCVFEQCVFIVIIPTV